MDIDDDEGMNTSSMWDPPSNECNNKKVSNGERYSHTHILHVSHSFTHHQYDTEASALVFPMMTNVQRLFVSLVHTHLA